MKSLIIYFKTQYLLLFTLILVNLGPFVAIRAFLPKVPYMHIFFILELFIFRIMIFNEARFIKLSKPVAINHLSQELKRTPSQKEIFNRTKSMSFNRDLTLIIFGCIIYLTQITILK